MPALEFDWNHFWAEPEPHEPKPSEAAVLESRTIHDTMCEYVQPDSTLSLAEAADRVLSVYDLVVEENRCDCLKEDTIQHAYKCIGEQISYDDPAQAKLMELFLSISKHPLYQNKFQFETSEASTDYCISHLRCAAEWGPFDPNERQEEGEDPMFYVNACALLAKILSRSLLITSCFFTAEFERAMEHPFWRGFRYHYKEDETTKERDAWIMGATQYIRWQAELIFSFVRKYDNPRPPLVTKSAWSKLKSKVYRIFFTDKEAQEERRRERQRYEEEGPEYEWEQWQSWLQKFKDVVNDDSYGEECRRLADETVSLMLLEEKKYAEARHVEQSTNTVIYKEKS